MLVECEIVNPAKEKNLINGVITITAECKLPDGRIIKALGKQNDIPVGIFCSKAFLDKLPITLITFPGSLDDPKVQYEIAPWPNQSDLFKAGLFSRLINITSQGLLETLEWGEADTNLLLNNSFRSQLENSFKKSNSIDETSGNEIKDEFFLNNKKKFKNTERNEFIDKLKNVINHKITYQGKSFPSISSLAKFLGVNPQTLRNRIKKGWPEEKWGLNK